ncbi:hypothetical protein [Sphingomonas sp.]|uniref:hypothetical protein n=1 Tax=Sphingomonas sp. TaxID=28214 RepID=UPI003AFF7C85
MSREEGSIVIEAMVAALIVAALAGTLFETVAANARTGRRVAEAERALLVARSRLAAAGVETPLATGIVEGRDGDLAWRVAVEPYEGDGASDVDPVSRVTVSVRDLRARVPLATLTSLRIGG